MTDIDPEISGGVEFNLDNQEKVRAPLTTKQFLARGAFWLAGLSVVIVGPGKWAISSAVEPQGEEIQQQLQEPIEQIQDAHQRVKNVEKTADELSEEVSTAADDLEEAMEALRSLGVIPNEVPESETANG